MSEDPYSRDERKAIIERWIADCKRAISVYRAEMSELSMQIESVREKLVETNKELKAYELFLKEINDED